jgi:SAM-dependent methyltransferase
MAKVQFDHDPVWHRSGKRHESCPACRHRGDIPLFLDINSTAPPHKRVTFARCPNCNAVFQLRFEQPRYDRHHSLPIAVKFYVEQGAAMDLLALPAFIARERAADRYLEIGCGFGFGLDFAKHAFGWEVHGIDPSPIAREGRRLLGVDIESNYLTMPGPGARPYQAISALEVIEHIPEPYEFLAILRANLASGGILVITTPNADYVEFATEKPGFLAVLTPGYHAIVYSPKSLEIALHNAGFADIQIVSRGATLLAVAGEGAAAIHTDRVFQAAVYETYLERRLATLEPHSVLGVGFSYRLFKHLINSGRFNDAEALQARLAKALLWRDRIDILNPHRLIASIAKPWAFEDFIEQLPACLVGLLYFSAMLRLNGHGDRSGALAYFYAAHVMAGLYRRAMIEFGIDDGETGDLELQARRHIKIVLDWMSG